VKGNYSAPKPVDAFIEDVIPVIPYVGQWLIAFSVDTGVALIHPLTQVMRGNRTGSLLDLSFQLVLTLVRYPMQLLLTVVSLVLNAIASLINNIAMQSHERALFPEERQYLKHVFGSSVDFDAVRIQFGGVKEALRISPQAVGNDIFIREFWGARTAYPDWTLTAAGMKLLGHEIAHVWQFQNTGAGYIGDSLITQTLDLVGRKLGIHLSDGYDLYSALKSKRSMSACNVEQQAVMAEMMCVACSIDACSDLTYDSFKRVTGFDLSEEEFTSVEKAKSWFGQTC